MIVQESLVAMASNEIRRLVVTGELAPGDRLHEPPLAQRLGISRPPLREALRVLETEGLLEQEPRRGYRVVAMTEQDIDEVYSLRRSLELFALDLALERDGPATFEALDPIMERMWRAAREGDTAEVIQGNVDFHVAVVEESRHSRLIRAYRSLMVQMQLCMTRNLLAEASSSGALDRGCERHDKLVESLRTGDRARIIAEFAAHGERTYLPSSDVAED